MKKLLTLTVFLFTLLIGANAISAKPPAKKKVTPVVTHNDRFPYENGYYNRRGVYIFHSTKIVWKRNGKYRNTYRHKIFPNGRRNKKLIKSVLIRPRHYRNGRVKVFYRTELIRRSWRTYRVKYKITRYPNGRIVKKVLSRKRVYV